MAVAVMAILGGVYVAAVGLRMSAQIHKAGALHRDSFGTTLFFSIIFLLPNIGVNIGIICTVLGDERTVAKNRFWRWPLVALFNFFFMCTALSVSFVWIEMVNRTKRAVRPNVVSGAPPRDSTSGGGSSSESGSRSRIREVTGLSSFLNIRLFEKLSYQNVVLFVSLLAGISTILMFVFGGDAFDVSTIIAVNILGAGGTFYYAGSKVHKTLMPAVQIIAPPAVVSGAFQGAEDDSSSGLSSDMLSLEHGDRGDGDRARLEAAGTKIAAIMSLAEHVQSTARGMGRCCCCLAFFILLYGAMRPSHRPLYRGQNNLPPFLSGQIAYFSVRAFTFLSLV